jgi:aspartyl-tRNA(Asn)/glutamyl-tRNA(Gln) amidotransferase subunit A
VLVDGHDLSIEWILTRLTCVFNVARLPAISVPCGLTMGGLPIGLQIVTRRMDEATALALANVAAVSLPEPALPVA